MLEGRRWREWGENAEGLVGDAALRLVGVSKRFGGVRALEDVSLTVRAGTIHGLIGPNGSGKTTALNVISGVLSADAGEVLLAGREVSRLPSHRRAALGMARTFQNPRVFGDLSVLDHLWIGQRPVRSTPFGAVLAGLPSVRRETERARDEARALGGSLGLGQLLDRSAGALAHGLQRRVELGRALAARPGLLLLDEPAAGLSGREVEALEATIRDARAAGTTVLLVEHHLELVLRLCDEVTVLDRGRVIAEGAPAAIRADARVAEVYLGTPEPDHAAS
ncbi:MAG: ABC transporter ATP-binding protein [Chloroflexi bacterium]|nr:ABC transporter ATP-binding protein [Chloroflexota bacterium]